MIGRLLAAAYGLAVLGIAVAVGSVLGTTTVLPLAVLRRGRRERLAMIPSVWFVKLIVDGLLWVDDRVDGTIDLAPNEGALILSNHRSWLDPVLLMLHTRSNGLSKGIIFFLPFIGLYAWLAGAVFFDRSDKHDRARARREVVDLVRSGHRLQVFPEGTRTRTGALGTRVYLNLPTDCWRAGLPVVCCAVWGTERVLPPGVFGAYPFQTVRLKIGRTLRPADYPDGRRFGQACWDEVKSLVAALEAEERAAAVCPGRDSNPHSLAGKGF